MIRRACGIGTCHDGKKLTIIKIDRMISIPADVPSRRRKKYCRELLGAEIKQRFGYSVQVVDIRLFYKINATRKKLQAYNEALQHYDAIIWRARAMPRDSRNYFVYDQLTLA